MTLPAPVRALTAALACALTFALATLGLTQTASAAPSSMSAAVRASPALASAASRPASVSATSGPLSVSLTSTAPTTLTSTTGLTVTAQVRNTGSSTLSGVTAHAAVGKKPLDSLDAQNGWLRSTARPTSPASADADVPDLAPGATTSVRLTLPSSDLDLSYSMATLPLLVSVDGAGHTASSRSFVTWSSSGTSYTKMTSSLVVPVVLPNDPKLFTTTGRERFDAWNKAIGPGSAIDSLLTSHPGVPVTWLIDPALLDPPAAQDSTLPRATPDAAAQNGSSSDASTSPGASSGSASPSGSTRSTNSSGSSPSTSSSAPGASGTAAPSDDSGSSDDSSASTSAPTASAGSDASDDSSGTDSPSSTGATSSSTSSPAAAPTSVEGLAARLRGELTSRPSNEQVAFTPYGDPDLSALTAADRPQGSDAVLARALARPLPQPLKDISETVLAAPVEPLDAGSAARLDAAWKKAHGASPTVLTPNATLDGTDDVAVTSAMRRTTSGLPLIGVNAALGEALSSTATDDAEAAASTRAASLAIYQQQPTTTRSLVVMGSRALISPARLNAVAHALHDVPWMQLEAFDPTAAASAPENVTLRARREAVPGLARAAFDAHDLETNTQSVSTLTALSHVVSDGDELVPMWTRNLDDAVGTHWRGHPSGPDAVVSGGRSTLAAVPGQVSVVPSRINFFSDSGAISVAIKNGLARDVHDVRVSLTPGTFAVQFRGQPAPVSIPAASQASVRVSTVAQAAARVSVDVRLTTPDGMTFGDRTRSTPALEINARPTGTWIFWALGIVALLVFCYGLVRSRQKGTRRRDELARDIQL